MDSATRQKLYDFIRKCGQAVVATAGRDGKPEAALIDIAVTAELDIIFETTSATRKFANLHTNPRVALVIGWAGSETLQVDGWASRLEGSLLEESLNLYLAAFPEKNSHRYWPGNYYFRVRPLWVRFSDYYQPREVLEYSFPRQGMPSARATDWRGFWPRPRWQRN